MRKNRKILAKLLELQKSKKITIIIGPRQSGKTTILNMIRDSIRSQGYNTLFLDIDLFSDFEKIATYENIINTLKLHGFQPGGKEPFFLFLDEFQRYEDTSLILKNLYDHQKNLKIYATGSSSLTVKHSIQESLAGRKLIYHLYPLDFEETLEFREDEDTIKLYKNIPSLEGKNLTPALGRLIQYLKESMIFGSYPEVILTENPKEKEEILRSILELYIKKELVEYLKIEKIYPVKLLIESLAVNNGQKVIYEGLSTVSGISQKSVRQYLEILEETFLIQIIRPFFTNKQKELVKIPKIYFVDPGVVNYFIKNFAPLELRKDAGFLFETFIFSEILKSGAEADRLKFWGDKNQREVDLVIESAAQLTAMEIKYKKIIKSENFSGLQAFYTMYNQRSPSLFLVNTGEQYQKDNIRLMLPFDIGRVL